MEPKLTRRGVLELLHSVAHVGGVTAEFLPERDRHCILQMRAAGLEHGGEARGLDLEGLGEA